LFLLVFVGRGVLPRQMADLRALLGADLDLGSAAAAFGQSVSEGGNVLEALEAFWADATGQTPLETAETPYPLPMLDGPAGRLERASPLIFPLPERAAAPAGAEAGAGAEPLPEPTPEPVVTAMAQEYSDTGEALPEKVSFQYYNLGLEETATPVLGTVTSAFGFRDHPVNGVYSFHTAVDIGVPKGTNVHAFADGTVRYIGENSVYGLYVRLDHENNTSTFYAHCSKLLVQKGDEVTCGQVIAKSGDTGNATGPHLHFSVEKDGIRLDPTLYLG